MGHDGLEDRLCGRSEEIIQCMVTMQQYVFSSVNSFAQKAALIALDYNTDTLIDRLQEKE